MQRWFEIALPVPADLIDEAAALLDFAGFGGVEVRETATAVHVVVVAESDGDASEHATSASQAIAILGAGEPQVTELDPLVWTENWKRHFARKVFTDRIEVRPPWEEASPSDSGLLSIVINPGMAFGTGLHETTAGCLELLVEEVRPGMRVADVGCGSGILAIAAARLGAIEAVATDVDPLAIDATAENIAANNVGDVVHVELEPGEVAIAEWEDDARPGLSAARRDSADARTRKDQAAASAHAGNATPRGGTPNGAQAGGFGSRGPGYFDLLVANILAEALVEMHVELMAAVRPGGTLILSGIASNRLKMVEEAFIGSSWCLARAIHKGDWVSLSVHHVALAEPKQTPSVRSGTQPPGAD